MFYEQNIVWECGGIYQQDKDRIRRCYYMTVFEAEVVDGFAVGLEGTDGQSDGSGI